MTLPARTYTAAGGANSSSIELFSHIELNLQEGAVIQGSTDWQDYLPVPTSVYNTTIEGSRRTLFYAHDAEDIAITGPGLVDEQGPSFFDQNSTLWTYFWAKPMLSSGTGDMDNRLPRPHMVRFFNCSGIRIIDANGETFALVCKTDLTSDATITINATLEAAKDASEGVFTVTSDLSGYPQLFVIGIGPAAK